MIQSVIVTSGNVGATITLTEENPSHGFFLKSIDGLGPAKANVNVGQMATNDGSYYNSSRLEQRNIVLQLLFDDSYYGAVENARMNAYTYFPIKGEVELQIQTAHRNVKTIGYVESIEPDIFSQQEGAQISIICPDPYFYDATDQGRTYTRINEHEQWEFTYNGDFPLGVEMEIQFRSASLQVGNILIRNETTDQEILIDSDRIYAYTGNVIQTGDVLKISTVKGNKKVYLVREGAGGETEINILNCLSLDTDWIYLKKGSNYFTFDMEIRNEPDDPSYTRTEKFTIKYRTAYGGV